MVLDVVWKVKWPIACRQHWSGKVVIWFEDLLLLLPLAKSEHTLHSSTNLAVFHGKLWKSKTRKNFESIFKVPGSRQWGLWWKFFGVGDRWRRHDVLKGIWNTGLDETSSRHEQIDFLLSWWLWGLRETPGCSPILVKLRDKIARASFICSVSTSLLHLYYY